MSYQMTTGKKYDDENAKICKSCGNRYKSENNKCPSCGSVECSKLEQTTANLKEVIITTKEK